MEDERGGEGGKGGDGWLPELLVNYQEPQPHAFQIRNVGRKQCVRISVLIIRGQPPAKVPTAKTGLSTKKMIMSSYSKK